MAFSGWYPSSYIRMPYSGIANNNVIWPWHVGDLYYEVSGIEKTIGLSPLGSFSTISDRISNIETWRLGNAMATTDTAIAVWSGALGNALANSSLLVSPNGTIKSTDSALFIQMQSASADMVLYSLNKGFQFSPSANSGIELLTTGGDEFIAPLINLYGNLGMPGKAWKSVRAKSILNSSAGFPDGNIGLGNSIWLSGYIANLESSSAKFDTVSPLGAVSTFIGSSTQPFTTGYFDGIVLNGATLTPGTGGITGPGTSTNNGIATWNGTTGAALFNNSVTLSLNILSGLSGIMPGQSGVTNMGSPEMPLATGYLNTVRSNQYATTFVSGIGETKTIDWNNGTSQILNFNGAASGTYTLTLANGIAGSAYVLGTTQNLSGTCSLTWSSNVVWQGGVSGVMTASSGVRDLFSFWYDGSKYLGSFSSNYY